MHCGRLDGVEPRRDSSRRAPPTQVGPRAGNVRRALRRAVVAVLVAGAAGVVATSLPAPSLAQQQEPPGRPPRSDRRGPRNAEGDAASKPASAAKAILEAELKAVEDEVAQYLQFRGDVPADGAARLELLVDLRVLARWLLAAAAAAAPDSELQVGGWFRAAEFRGAAAALAEHFKQLPKPTPAQLEAMRKINAATFVLPPLKDLRAADDVCKDVGLQLVYAAGPLPPDVRQLPLMRPGVKPDGRTAPATAPPAGGSDADPLARANALTVSAALKKQVVALASVAAAARQTAATLPSIPVPSANASATLVAAAAAVDRKRDDAAALAAMTARALELAEGMGWSGGVEPASRPALEQQLADGLALFVDPRTRPAGQQRLAALDAYAQTVARVRRMNLGPDLRRRLGPALVWAGEHPELGAKLVGAVEAYVAAGRRADARADALRAAPAAAQPPLPPREAKAVADALKVVAAEREAFLVDAAGLARPGVVADVGLMTQRVDSMRAALDAADLYERVPKAVAILLSYKPRPTGGLERRVNQAMTVLADPRAAGNREEANRTLSDVVRLGDLAGEAEAAHGGGPPVPPDVAKAYAKNRLPAFDAKRKDLVADLVMTLAGGKEVDTVRLRRLDQMRAVRAALAEAAAFELALRSAPVLARWADWPVDPAELQAVFGPYREAVVASVEALATDATPPATFDAVRAKYAPAMRAVVRAGAQADVCGAFPPGWPGHAARLMTPLANQPFAVDRQAAYLLKLWALAEQANDAKAVEAAAEAMRAVGGGK
jgi:hypothetical protein